jgi:hypothetical protein
MVEEESKVDAGTNLSIGKRRMEKYFSHDPDEIFTIMKQSPLSGDFCQSATDDDIY